MPPVVVVAQVGYLSGNVLGGVMVFTVTVDRDEDGVWVVECPSIPGCVSQGKTKEEALENVKDAIRLCLEVRGEKGLPLTIETRQVEVAA
jgi:predicted RNase H-like HicB family nuclease